MVTVFSFRCDYSALSLTFPFACIFFFPDFLYVGLVEFFLVLLNSSFHRLQPRARFSLLPVLVNAEHFTFGLALHTACTCVLIEALG